MAFRAGGLRLLWGATLGEKASHLQPDIHQGIIALPALAFELRAGLFTSGR